MQCNAMPPAQQARIQIPSCASSPAATRAGRCVQVVGRGLACGGLCRRCGGQRVMVLPVGG
jgi:hypothetical protein